MASSSRPSPRSSCSSITTVSENIVMEILSWLPVACLLRCKSVCKSWYHLIQTSFFINHHLRRHHRDNTSNYNLFVMKCGYKYEDYKIGGLRFSLLSCENFEFSQPIHLPILSQLYIPYMHLVICDGIICLYYDYLFGRDGSSEYYFVEVFMWNPATKHFRVLPRPSVPVDSDYPCISIGFGFDTVSSDYKLVMIIIYNEMTQCQVQVYSLSTNSWRVIYTHFPVDCVKRIVSNPNAPYKIGTYCWFGARGPLLLHPNVLYEYYILSFDFSTEKFETIPLPDAFNVKQDPFPLLAILNGNIACVNKTALLDDDASGDRSEIEVWVLKEYGIKESWTKLYTVGPFLGPFPKVLLKDRFLMLEDWYQLGIYDIFTRKINITLEEDPCYFGDDKYMRTAIYKESLVSIKGREGAFGTASEDNSNWYNWLP